MDGWEEVHFTTKRNFKAFPGVHEDEHRRVERAGHLDKRPELTRWVQEVGMTVGDRSVCDIGKDLFDLCCEMLKEHDYIVFRFNKGEEDVYYRCGEN